MAAPASYILCGTPRTGSTELCSLLSSTGVLGHPESYFREPTTWRPQLTHRKQADEVSAAHVSALRVALEGDGR